MSLMTQEANSLQWRKARRSAGNGACVEVAAAQRTILIRDSHDPRGPVLRYSPGSWGSFLDNLKRVTPR